MPDTDYVALTKSKTREQAQAMLDQALAALATQLPPQKRMPLAIEQTEVRYLPCGDDTREIQGVATPLIARSIYFADDPLPAIAEWRKEFLAAVATNPGDVLWWRVMPNIERFVDFDRDAVNWQTFSRFVMVRA
jgi:hypothetical protein